MLKRILAIACGMLLGSVLAVGVARWFGLYGWWPGDEADASAAYVREVLELVHGRYVEAEEVKIDELTKSALAGIVASLDPHSEFMEARKYEALQEDIHNQFGGIGVQVEMQDDEVVVIAPIEGTPGEAAGILRADRIVSVDGERLVEPTLDDVVTKLRGPPGTDVAVGLYRPSDDREFTVTLTREIIQVDSVSDVRMLSDETGYINISQFSERTGTEVREALDRLLREGMTALVLDLRNNPGGLLSAAVAVAEPFFPRGELIVYTEGRDASDREVFRSSLRGTAVDLPVAVLINSGSASAAEIVAGALKDTRRAVIVGERSFGKGSVQTLFRLKDGEALRLTTARYYTPAGVTIHERGVSPDVELVMTPQEDLNLRRQRARTDIVDPEEFRRRYGEEPIPDRQLEAALDVLQAARLLDERRLAATAP